MRVGITGHQELKDPRDWDWVKVKIDDLLTTLPKPIVGLTCLAVGADSLFARIVLQHSGLIEAVIPLPGYELTFQARDRDDYRWLIGRASKVTNLPRESTDEESYFEAGKRVVDLADLVIAVWDGKPAKGLGGTADIVEYARQRRKAMIHFDPVQHLVDGSPQLDCLDTSKKH